jgi:hypothetical protein
VLLNDRIEVSPQFHALHIDRTRGAEGGLPSGPRLNRMHHQLTRWLARTLYLVIRAGYQLLGGTQAFLVGSS